MHHERSETNDPSRRPLEPAAAPSSSDQRASAPLPFDLRVRPLREQPEEARVIDFAVFFRAILRGVPVLVLVVAISVIAACIYLRYAEYSYTISLKVVPVSTRSAGDFTSSLVGSLASIALPKSKEDVNFELYIDGLTSLAAAQRLATNDQLMRAVFAAQWSEAKKGWVEPPLTLPQAVWTNFKKMVGIPVYSWQPPGPKHLQRYLQSTIKIKSERQSSIYTVSISVADAEFGSMLLRELNGAVDNLIRTRTITRTEQYIEYLNEKIRSVAVLDYRSALIGALAQQEGVRMTASSNVSFAVETYGEPVSTILPDSPRPFLVLAASGVAGFVLGCLIALVIDRGRSARVRSNPA